MSLVHLANVCSHLQNASLARLGLTSIPYTHLHLSLSLLLHKQGFLSQLKLAGPSPPASCFPPGLRDDHAHSAHPHVDRSSSGGEAALAEMVLRHKTRQQLEEQGFDRESIDFAVEHRELNKEQLEREGWDGHVIDFLVEHGSKSQEQLEAEGFDSEAVQIAETYNVQAIIQQAEPLALQALERDLKEDLRGRGVEPNDLSSTDLHDLLEPEVERRLPPYVQRQTRLLLRRQGFSLSTLQYFAGSHKYLTPRHLHQDGISVEAMGLTIPNQPVTALPPQYRDPWNLETEGLVTQSNRASRRLWLGLKYWDGMPVLRKARMLSKPTKRIWLNSHDLARLTRGESAYKGQVKGMTQVGEILAVSTDKGVLEARECVERRIGGMVLCRIS